MMFGFITAIATAAITIALVSPLMRERQTAKAGWAIVVVLPLAALALYAWLGAPELAQ